MPSSMPKQAAKQQLHEQDSGALIKAGNGGDDFDPCIETPEQVGDLMAGMRCELCCRQAADLLHHMK